MNQYKQLKLSVEESQQALNKLQQVLITVTEIMNTFSGNEAFAEYQKRKSATNYHKALESMPEAKRHALDNGEWSQ